MSSRNGIIVLSIILGSLLVLGLVIALRDAGLGGSAFDKGQRFTAKPGTTRENAILLTSNKRAETEDPEDPIARRSDKKEDPSDPLEVKSLSKSEEGDEKGGRAGEAARAALNNYSPEAGLRQLEAALDLPNTPEQAAILHDAAGQLHTQTNPPDYDKSLESFETAAGLTQDPELQEELAFNTAQMLMQAGRDAEARDKIEAYLADNPPAGPTGYKLQIVHGQLLERAGQLEAAENTYQSVLDAAREVPGALERDAALSLTRLAGLRLTSLYRKNDRDQAADVLSKDLKRQLARLEEL